MDIVSISNMFNIVSGAHCEINSYHAGWPSDITLNISNVYNRDGDTGTVFPHMQWVFPIDGQLNITKQSNKQTINIELRLYDTQNFRGADVISDDNPVTPIAKVSAKTTETLIERWRRLNRIMVEFLREVNDLQQHDVQYGGYRFHIPPQDFDYWTDSNYGPDGLIYFGVKFYLFIFVDCGVGCINYELIPPEFPSKSELDPPDPFGTTDWEDVLCSEDDDPIDITTP